MIQNFDNVKKQLGELAGLINSFKSEAVQLRIIELIFGGSFEARHDDERDGEAVGLKKKSPRRKTKRKARGAKKGGAKRKPSSGTGAAATLNQLAEGDFFNTPRTINDIIQHCKENLARGFKANEFSGKLARMVRSGELTRQKNADNQYEYKKA